MSTRYVAVIKIIRVDETEAVTSRYENQSKPATSKDTELASIVARGSDLVNLLEKTKLHIDLVEDTK